MPSADIQASLKQCSVCRQTKALSAFHWARRNQDKRKAHCRDCDRDKMTVQRAKRKLNGKALAYNVARRPRQYAVRLRRVFGISISEYEGRLAAQDSRCAICQLPERATIRKTGTLRMLAVDHDHASGTIRGLLCSTCNNGLGNFRDNPRLLAAAIGYLTSSYSE